MNKQDRKTSVQSKEMWKQRVRDYWPVVPLSAMGVLTMFAMSRQPAHADGGTWTLPYSGTVSATSNNAIYANNTGTNGSALFGNSDNGVGVYGQSASSSNYGVIGSNLATTGNAIGVQGQSSSNAGYGVAGYNLTTGGTPAGVYGDVNNANGYGVIGGNAATTGNSVGIVGVTSSAGGYGVYGIGNSGTGVYGTGTTFGINGNSAGTGVAGSSTASSGGSSGVFGTSSNTAGVYGYSTNSIGVRGASVSDKGVAGYSSSSTSYGVAGYNSATSGNSIGVYGSTSSSNGYAGFFSGNTYVSGTATCATASVSGTLVASNVNVYNNVNANTFNGVTKYFKIDHPLDPANKYLVHSCVESNERLDMYNGVIPLDSDGKATVEMPGYFEALNKDFRYQLTAIGAPGPNLYIAEEMDHNKFVIAGGSAGMKVSWQVTGVRHDAYAAAHPMQVEQDKAPKDRGKYVTPIEQGQPETQGINYIKPVKPIVQDVLPPKPPAIPKSLSSGPKIPTLPPILKAGKTAITTSSKP